jgi:hypothetical protein
MSHPAGPPRLATAAAAFVVASLSVVSVPSARAQSQDTTGHNGWGIVYSSPRSRQQAAAATAVTATPASAPSGSASGTVSNGATSTTGKAATGWANGAGAAGSAAPAPQSAAAGANSPYISSYTPTLSAHAPDPAPSSAAQPAAAASANGPTARVPGVIYSSNGAVAYQPPPRPADPPPAAAQPAAPAPQAAYQSAPPPPPTFQAAPAPTTYSAAPPTAYQAAPPTTYQSAADPAQAPRVQPYPAQSYPAQSYQAQSYPAQPAPAPTYQSQPAAQTYPAPSNPAQTYYPAPSAPAPAYAGANQYPNDRPTNLPPNGRTDASYDVDTNPPPGGAPTPVASLPGPGGASSSSIHLDELMSLHEWESSGVSRLKPQEIAVLEKWLERYRQQVADSVTRAFGAPHASGAPNTPVPPISRTSDGTPKNAHAVTAIRSGSRYITLDDGSVWDVYPSDQTETAAWQQGDLVQVRVAPVAYGEFDHELVNNQRTGPVRAKFMGYAARQ